MLRNDKNSLDNRNEVPKPMDEIDRASFKAGPSPLDSEPCVIDLQEGTLEHPDGPQVISLDGGWQMAEGGDEANRLSGDWNDAIPAIIPGGVHAALVKAGRIPDPMVGKNMETAEKESFKTWWLKREFERNNLSGERLLFGGVAIRCTVWLNGKKLGSHEGMFGGPEFDITGQIKEKNVLIVKIDPVKFVPKKGGTNPRDNISWRNTVVFNNVYGWHYSNIPSLGIWRSVKIEDSPTVELVHPFVATKNALSGVVDLAFTLKGSEGGWSGKIIGTVQPENFQGRAYHFEHGVRSDEGTKEVHHSFTIPDPKIWWPVDLGDPNLYRLMLSFIPDSGGVPDKREVIFGIRTIEMIPLPGGPRPDKFNWTFVINGKLHFVKGTGWCTMDALLDFSRERYDRFLTLAADQHVQMLRCWGSGMPETDDFYDLCDRKGITVLQEWPTAWDSHKEQPLDILEETVRLNTLRLRNHPSLVMWGGGNESKDPFGVAIDMMGRLSIELDGTRAFHRGEPWGGSTHNYNCYWGRRHLDHNLTMTSDFFGEFGLACMPVYESVQRYLPDDEKDLWSPPEDSSFAYHTPIFNTRQDLSRLTQYARYFVRKDYSMEEFIVGSQLSQAVGVRHTLERARTRWPHCAGALYYKINDNYPAASWSCVDWYGVPKIGYYFFQDAFAPLHACAIFSTVNSVGTPLELPIFLLDDADELKDKGWYVIVRAYDGKIKEIKRTKFCGNDSIDSPLLLGEFTLEFKQTDISPLFTVVEVRVNGALADRIFYWINYEAVKGCLFRLPKTKLSLTPLEKEVIVKNIGDLPAVAVNIARPGHLHTFRVEDNYFWLDVGEEKTLWVSECDGLTVSAWNSEV